MVNMKKLLVLLCLVVSFAGHSQARMGYSYEEIRAEFANDYGFDYVTGYDDKLGKFLKFFVGTGVIHYYFNEEGNCYTMIILPNTKSDLHYYIEKYNATYAIIDDHTWHLYDHGVVVIITLEYVEDGGYFFLFYYK